MKRKVKYFNKVYKKGDVSFQKINQSVQSWVGHAKHGDTYHLRKNILSKLVLSKN